MEEDKEGKRKPVALFMAFGTQGDVYPIAAIAAAFACDQKHYHVVLMSHSAHGNLTHHLEKACVTFYPVSSPPVLSIQGPSETTFSLQKQRIVKEHRRDCYLAVERFFGDGPSREGDFIVINFFALEGWSFAELFHIRCVIAAPYIVPYSAPASFERQFRVELPALYRYLKEAPAGKICWNDVTHWMWPLFMDEWGSWRSEELSLSYCPFTDPVTGLPTWYYRPASPLLLYGFSKEVVECPDYWPSNVRVCGFWFQANEWQFSCKSCRELSVIPSGKLPTEKNEICSTHVALHLFLRSDTAAPLIFIGLSSIGSMGFLKNPRALLRTLQTVIDITCYNFMLFTAGYEPLDATVNAIAAESSSSGKQSLEAGISLFDHRLFCFSGMLPYNWLFPKCAAAIHHGGSGSTAAALHAGIPQIICPFMLDQFYWAEKMFWLGVSPEPLKRKHLVPEEIDEACIMEASDMLSKAIQEALSHKIRKRASEIAETIKLEDGVSEAVKALKEEINSWGRNIN